MFAKTVFVTVDWVSFAARFTRARLRRLASVNETGRLRLMNSHILPLITEVKRTLAGREKRFTCGVLRRDGAHLVVLFVAPGAMNVHGVILPAGTVTFGHFWTNRPYNIYHWLDPLTGATIGHYVNLAADTTISADRLEWLDLIVDLLMLPGQPTVVLDQDEIPADADATLRARIDDARATALQDWPAMLVELERHQAALWPLARREIEAGTDTGACQ